MSQFLTRGESVSDSGFCFFVWSVEQRAVPTLEVAGRCDVCPLGIKCWAFGQSPMSGDALTIDTKAGTLGFHDEAVIFKLAEPDCNRACGLGAKIGGGIAMGAENLSIVQVVYPQEASQHDVQTSRAER